MRQNKFRIKNLNKLYRNLIIFPFIFILAACASPPAARGVAAHNGTLVRYDDWLMKEGDESLGQAKAHREFTERTASHSRTSSSGE